jgi:NADH-quinone oxidoreductase subunit N
MTFDIASLWPVLPEIFLLTAACGVLVIDVFLHDRNRMVTYGLSLASLLVTIWLVGATRGEGTQIVLQGAYVRDAMGDVLKVALLLAALVSFVYAKDYLRARKLFRGEYYVLGLFATLGTLIMVSANSFLIVYLGLELLALCLYALVAFDRDSPKGAEAAMKYFVLGALASGLLLYGISMVYGVTGALDFPTVAASIAGGTGEPLVLVFGLVFIVIGIAFKFGAVPFHMWVPDIYHGSPMVVALFLGSAPKVAAFALAMRLLVDGMGALHADWQGMLVILAVLSLALGNLVAIAQDNIKRMLAYSTISHVGFIFMGLLAGTDEGYSAAMFYAIVYAFMAAGAFGILAMLSREGFEAENLDDLKGLNDRSPWLAGMMLLVMFSMAGVPPTVGFFAKLFVLDAVISIDMVWLALVGVFFSIIGAYYYIRIVKLMYFDKPVSETPIVAGMDTRIVVSANGLAMLALGLFPAGLFGACQVAIAG